MKAKSDEAEEVMNELENLTKKAEKDGKQSNGVTHIFDNKFSNCLCTQDFENKKCG